MAQHVVYLSLRDFRQGVRNPIGAEPDRGLTPGLDLVLDQGRSTEVHFGLGKQVVVGGHQLLQGVLLDLVSISVITQGVECLLIHAARFVSDDPGRGDRFLNVYILVGHYRFHEYRLFAAVPKWGLGY